MKPIDLFTIQKRVKEIFFYHLKDLLIGLVILVLLLNLAIYTALNLESSIPRFQVINKIDKLVSQEDRNSLFQSLDTIPENYILINDFNQSKDFSPVSSIVQENILYPNNKKIAEGVYEYKNISSDSNYQLLLEETETNKLKITYNREKEKIDFVIPSYKYMIGKHEYTTKEIIVYTIRDLQGDEIFKIGENIVIDIENYENDKFVTTDEIEEKEITFFEKEEENLLAEYNPSFEDGLWEETVGNCSNTYPGEPEINMELVENDSSDGNKSLLLESSNHFACTNQIIPFKFTEGNIYKFGFDYKNLAGNTLLYEFELLTNETTTQTYQGSEIEVKKGELNFNYLDIQNSEWNSFNTFIVPKEYEKIENVRIRFTSPSGGEEVINLFDKIDFEEFVPTENISELEEITDLSTEQILLDEVRIKSGLNEIKYLANSQNLLENQNPSFEEGLWNEDARNCNNNFLGEENIDLGVSRDSSDKKNSSRVASENHYACTRKNFPIDLGGEMKYKFSFDYKNISGKLAQYYIIFVSEDKVDEEENVGFSKILDSSEINVVGERLTVISRNDWFKYEKIIDPEIENIKSLIIHLLSPSEGDMKVINLYDNVRLEEFAPKDIDNYYLYSEQEVDESPKVDSLEYTNLDRYTHKVRLNGLEDSTLVYFPEGYSDSWKAFPIQTDEPPEEQNVSDFTVPQEESNRQADSQEVRAYFDQGKVSTVGDKYIGKNFDDSIRNDNLKPGGTLSVLGKQAIDGSRHYKLNDYGNAWYIDVEEYCKNRNVCVDNGDGTFDLELIIRHENKFYLQLIQASSLLSFLIPIGWLTRKKILPKINNKPSLFENTNKEKPPVKEIDPEPDYKESKETNNEKKNEYFEKYINREGEPIELTGDEKPNPKNSISTQKIKKSEGKKTISSKSFRIADLIGTSDSKETSEPIEKQMPSSKKYVDLVIEPRKKSKDIRRLSSDESKSIKTVPVEDNSDELD
jgi:hypothetical protein